MGFYIDPDPNVITKPNWLKKNGKLVSFEDFRDFDFNDPETKHLVPVILVDNHGAFFAAGIAYCEKERNAFLHPDQRPKWYYLVEKMKIGPEVCIPESIAKDIGLR